MTTVWCLALAALTYVLGLGAGAVLLLPGWSAAVALDGLAHLLATAGMTVLMAMPFAVAASLGRGYMAAVGVMFLAIFRRRSSPRSATARIGPAR